MVEPRWSYTAGSHGIRRASVNPKLQATWATREYPLPWSLSNMQDKVPFHRNFEKCPVYSHQHSIL